MKIIQFVFTILFITAQSSLFGQTPPVASNVKVLGEALYNSSTGEASTLTGSYDFSDTDGDLESGTTYQWYRDIDGNGPETGEEIAGATSIRYTILSNDVNYNLYFEVTPADDSGETGTAVASPTGTPATTTTYTDVALTYAGVSSYTDNSDADYLNATMKNNTSYTVDGSTTTVTIHGDFDLDGKNGITINVTNGATLTIKGELVTNNNVSINVDTDATLIFESGLDAKNGSTLSISGNMTVSGDISVEGNANFDVASGGTLAVDGNVNLGNNASVTLDGDMNVDGDLDAGSNGTITVNNTGSLDIAGDLIGTASIEGTGPVTVGGQVGSGITDTDSNQLTVLPIELSSFKVALFRDRVIVHWITVSEKHNDYFTIERSTDGVNFTKIATQPGAGNSVEKLTTPL